jgi:hypothetical protein
MPLWVVGNHDAVRSSLRQVVTMNPEDPNEPEDLRQAVDALFVLDDDDDLDPEELPWWARPLTDADTEQIRVNRQRRDEEQEW